MKLIKGDLLSEKQKEYVLNAFIYRWTTGNRMRTQVYRCSKCDIENPYVNAKNCNGHTHPTIPLQADEEWLKEHAFWITKSGEVSMTHKQAEPAFMAS